MLTKRHAFRPDVSAAALEDRLVLSGSPATVGAIARLLGVSQGPVSPSRNESSRLAIRDLYLTRFRRDFTTFGIQFDSAASQITSDPSAARSAVSQSLSTLTTNVTKALTLSPRAARSLTPAARGLLIGPGPKSLASQLTALPPTSTSAQGPGIIFNAQLQLNNAVNIFTRSPNFDFSRFFTGTGTPTGTTVTTGTPTGGAAGGAGSTPTGTTVTTGTPTGGAAGGAGSTPTGTTVTTGTSTGGAAGGAGGTTTGTTPRSAIAAAILDQLLRQLRQQNALNNALLGNIAG